MCWLGIISKSFQQHSSGGDALEPGMCNETNIHPSCRTNEEETIKGSILLRPRKRVKTSDFSYVYAL